MTRDADGPETPDERLPDELLRRLREWPEDRPPDDLAVEDRVVEALRTRGFLRRGGRGSIPWRLAAALAAVALGGFAVGRLSHASVGAGDARPRYVLLLRESSDAPHAAATEAELTGQYSRWAASQRAAGFLESGEKLSPTGASRAEGRISGFFIVRARDLDEARRIADSSPHSARREPIEVRRIVETQ